jgi:hypothetical membrane protein
MKTRGYFLFGVLGPLLVYLSILTSLVLSPWFSWSNNALSDLGNPNISDVAWIFNLGLLFSGFLLMIYTTTVFKKHAKYSSSCLLASTFLVQLLAAINESYGSLHYVVAVPHFVMLSVTSIVYTIEKRSIFALLTFVIVMFSWLIYAVNTFSIGIAFPETVSKLVLLWIIYSAIKIYRKID